MTQMTFRIWMVAFYGAFCLWLILAVWQACDHQFFYALDDAYIHLSIAETIAHGGYGINAGEYASPSSSILFPFLLAPFALWKLGTFAPLVIDVAAGGLSMWLLAGFIHRYLAASDGRATITPLWLLIAPWLVAALNMAALPITGMEHPLHVLATIVIMLGLIEEGETGQVTRSLALGILVAPLLRFEGLALSGSAILVLAWRGHRAWAAGLSLALVACLGIYALLALSHGLPPIPSSVMVKSLVSAAVLDRDRHTFLSGLLANLAASWANPSGKVLIAGIVLMLPALRHVRLHGQRVADPRAGVALAAIAALFAHLVLGAYGWFGRYEIYAIALMLVGTAYTLAPALRRVGPAALRLMTCCLVLGFPAQTFLPVALETPAGARNVYLQQAQMHHFAVDLFAYPVAVNDIGLTSYRNDRYVLDLWGLGSEEARKLARSGRRDAAAIDGLARRHGIVYAMIYESWFPGQIPAGWQRLAQLRTPRVTSGGSVVSFYLVDPAQAPAMCTALLRLGPALPKGASLVTSSCGSF